MSGSRELTYAVDFRSAKPSNRQTPDGEGVGTSIPRVARLMAIAIQFERLVRTGTIRDYAELARLGRVTRARITQIMKLLDLAPDIQEQILFLPSTKGLNERNLRRIVSKLDWTEQRRMFQRITGRRASDPTRPPLLSSVCRNAESEQWSCLSIRPDAPEKAGAICTAAAHFSDAFVSIAFPRFRRPTIQDFFRAAAAASKRPSTSSSRAPLGLSEEPEIHCPGFQAGAPRRYQP